MPPAGETPDQTPTQIPDLTCDICNRLFAGKYASECLRRHRKNKHGIPLADQPRRSRWESQPRLSNAERTRRCRESKIEHRKRRKLQQRVKELLGKVQAVDTLVSLSSSVNHGTQVHDTTLSSAVLSDSLNSFDSNMLEHMLHSLHFYPV
jgi:hypothetical protein